jgi:predicted RNA binding protein YcfA (HicA-like mRNA interferase family)
VPCNPAHPPGQCPPGTSQARHTLTWVRTSLLLARLRGGDLANVRFADFQRLVEAVGFVPLRTRGSHHIYRHPNTPILLNLQNADGMAKPYQIRQFLRTMDEDGLTPGGSE